MHVAVEPDRDLWTGDGTYDRVMTRRDIEFIRLSRCGMEHAQDPASAAKLQWLANLDSHDVGLIPAVTPIYYAGICGPSATVGAAVADEVVLRQRLGTAGLLAGRRIGGN